MQRTTREYETREYELRHRRDEGEPAKTLDALFEAHAGAVYRFCLARTGSYTSAEDITADTFADAARLFARGEGHAVTIQWLISVARRRMIDRWRSNERHRQKLAWLLSQPLPETNEPDVSHWVTFEALQALPERQRAALTMRYLDQYSVPEVAESLECTYEAAESLLARGRRSLALLLENVE